MGALPKFLLCLAPAACAYGLLLVSPNGPEGMLEVMIGLLVIGALLSGFFAMAGLMRSMEPKGEATPLKVALAILVFLGVGVGYFALAMAGCCGLAVAVG